MVSCSSDLMEAVFKMTKMKSLGYLLKENERDEVGMWDTGP